MKCLPRKNRNHPQTKSNEQSKQLKAFRRPVQPFEVENCLSLYDIVAKQNQRFELCVRAALLRVLVSSYFLFRAELDPLDVEPSVMYAVKQFCGLRCSNALAHHRKNWATAQAC